MKLHKYAASAPYLKAKFEIRFSTVWYGVTQGQRKYRKILKGMEQDTDSDITVEDIILRTSKSFAPIIIPLVDILSQLTEEDLPQSPIIEHAISLQ